MQIGLSAGTHNARDGGQGCSLTEVSDTDSRVIAESETSSSAGGSDENG